MLMAIQSIKCSECGKIFRSSATASFHAEKTGHQEFEESTEEVGDFILLLYVQLIGASTD